MNTDTAASATRKSVTRRITLMIVIPVVILTLINFIAIGGISNKMRVTAGIRDDMNRANNILLGELTEAQSTLLVFTNQVNRVALRSQAIALGTSTNSDTISIQDIRNTLQSLQNQTEEINRRILEMKYTTPQERSDSESAYNKRLIRLNLIWPEKEDDSKYVRDLKNNLDQFGQQVSAFSRNTNVLSQNISSETIQQLQSTLSQLEPAAIALTALTQNTNKVKTARVFKLLNETKVIISKQIASSMALTIVVAIILISILVFSAKRKISEPLKTLAKKINHIEKNADLSTPINIDNQDEIGAIAKSFNAMLENFRNIVAQVTDTAALITKDSRDTSNVMASACSGLENQKQSTNNIANYVAELLETTEHVAGNTARTAEKSNVAQNSTTESQEVSQQAVTFIHELSENVGEAGSIIDKVVTESEQIDQVISVINSISEQTNLLALNAAIESARAGEAGRGFAVVADEVRVLAQRTQGSTKEIQEIMQALKQGSVDAAIATQHSISKAENSVEQVKQTASALEAIGQAVVDIHHENSQITEATKTQHQAAKNIHSNMDEIRNISEQTNSAAQQALEACNTLFDESEKLRALVQQFKV